MSLAKEVHDFIQSKLAVPEQETGVLPLLRLLASRTVLPPQQQGAEPSTLPPVNEMIPDTGKLQTNMQKNSLMSKYPGLGAK